MPYLDQTQVYVARSTTFRDALYYTAQHYIFRGSVGIGGTRDIARKFSALPTTALMCPLELPNLQRTRDRHGLQAAYHKPMMATVGKITMLPDGSVTQLPARLVKAMGTPLDLPLAPNLTWNTPELNERERAYRYIEKAPIWTDTRGAISHVGTKYKEMVAQAGRRMALTCRGYKYTVKRGGCPGYQLSKVPGTTAAQEGNYFLYRQPLRMFNPYEGTWTNTYWVGVASCMNYRRALRNAYLYNFGSQIHDPETLNDWIKTPAKAASVNPFERYFAPPNPLEFSPDDWATYAAQDLSTYAPAPSDDVLKHINTSEALQFSPMGLLVRRLEEQQQAKTDELKVLSAELQAAQDQRTALETSIKDQLQLIEQARSTISNAEIDLPALRRQQAQLEPKVKARRNILDRIRTQVERKRVEFNGRKAQYMEQLADDPSIPDYAAGLLKSGIVIDELTYRSPTGNQVTATADPSITIKRGYKLIQAVMHTVRPIPIVFGLDEHDLPPRASGPHKIIISDTDSQVRCSIAALTPWSCIGTKNDSYKPFPHTLWQSLDRRSPSTYTDSVTRQVSVCLGELGPSAAQAFRNNSPKQLALAVLSFLQSSDPEDGYGQAYQYFPLASKVVVRQVSSYVPPSTTPAYPLKYFINHDNTKYLEVGRKNRYTTCRYGDLQLVDGQYYELTTATDDTIADYEHYRYPGDYIQRSWYGYGYSMKRLVQIHRIQTGPAPAWHPRRGAIYSAATT